MPFTTPGVTQLFDMLQTRLENITLTNGYPIDLAGVHRGRLEPPTEDELPYLNFWATGLAREGQGTTAGAGTKADYLQNSRQLLVTIAITDKANGTNFVDVASQLADCVETAINRDDATPNVDDDPLPYLDPYADIRVDTISYYVAAQNEPYVTAELEILLIHRTVNGTPYLLEELF